MVPVLNTTYGMLVNEDLFEKEGLEIPRSYEELVTVCEAFVQAGYENPVMGYNVVNGMYVSLIYPYFCSTLQADPQAIESLNALDPAAGEYMRSALEREKDFMDRGFIDLETCTQFADGYGEIILRFFEGDVPMMLGSGDTMSGTQKRESMSEAFMAAPFTYSFYPVPMGDDGGIFYNNVAMEFAVNKEAGNLEIANEFMRFLLREEELNTLAQIKRLITTSKNLSFDEAYAAFGQIPEDHVIYAEAFGVSDAVLKQFRGASYAVANGQMSVDEAVQAFGTFE